MGCARRFAPRDGSRTGPATVPAGALTRLDLMVQVDVQAKNYDAESLQLAMIDRGYPMPLYFTDPKG
jgi:hypothetical protein